LKGQAIESSQAFRKGHLRGRTVLTRHDPKYAAIRYNIAAISADAGIVTTQAITIPLATPHRTAEVQRAAPTPMIDPVIV
jgi:hypothetical protein